MDLVTGVYQAMHKSIIPLLIVLLMAIALPTWAKDDEVAPPTAIYYQIMEPFTINFLSQSNKQVRFLQIKVALMAHDQSIIDSAEVNLPMLQDGLRTLFSEQSIDTVNSVEGRQALQASSLTMVKALLKEEIGEDNIEAVYFTSFVLQ